jgi:hypothetical protein
MIFPLMGFLRMGVLIPGIFGFGIEYNAHMYAHGALTEANIVE